jgi:hypothetical protein
MLGAAKTKEIANLQNVCIFLNDCKTKHQIYNLKKNVKQTVDLQNINKEVKIYKMQRFS